MSAGPLRILVVDDDRDSAESIGMILETKGYVVTIANSGEEAIGQFNSETFDITLMDVRLPGINGTESFLEIRKKHPEARVIMMTGYSVEHLLTEAVDNGAWGVLHKPLDIPKLMSLLGTIKPDGIMIVDDDADFLSSIQSLLTNEGYRVFVANDGPKAIDRVVSNGIDILILDLKLPLLSGLETYLELKAKGHVLPTIIVTAHSADYSDDIDLLQSMEVSGVLQKPFDPDVLLTALEKISRQ